MELTIGKVYTVKRYPKGEEFVVRQCEYYGFDLGKHIFTTVDDGYLYPPKVISISPSRLTARVSDGWTDYKPSHKCRDDSPRTLLLRRESNPLK
jgi:hypothetical protein